MSRIARLKRDLSVYAKEEVEVELIGDQHVAWGSEVATLRLYRKYQGSSKVNQGFSSNMNSWYFQIQA